ncbi:hypothetical protein [Rubripirellula reticaptiva]|uniref:ABC-2 family transporter protein n=1 Tax=Rubripirellula reticaptiva TaxID=2528013 RepID=A0A5C6EJH8_9BACT|nr:hypothetical protein [Rubripirellula reticaptiva]TWU49192.1 ABC-2 family transporter protein [Rubripirellula reticaptiva]
MNVIDSFISRNRWLWWKEFRMLMPLVGLLVGVTILLFFISSFVDRSLYTITYSDDLRRLVPLAFPLLFAVGSGAVLVGQEREMRTIEWMSSLPLTPRQWVTTKTVVATVGLAIMWGFAALCLSMTDGGGGVGSRWRISGAAGVSSSPIGYPLWFLFSIYLMLCGFYTAWRVKDQFHAIVLLIALACGPILLTEAFRWTFNVVNDRNHGADDLQGVTFMFTAILTGLIGWRSQRAAMTTLLPKVADDRETLANETTGHPASFWSSAPMLGTSWSSMIWQSARSAPIAFAITATMVLVGLIVPLTLPQGEANNIAATFAPLLILLGPLAIAWLGVLVFQNDGSAARLRFLADRGVSPTKVYLARHAVPLSTFAFCLIVYTIVSIWRAESVETQHRPFLVPSLLTIAMMGWVMYSVSQWTSQLFRTLVLSVIVSPILAAMVLGWLIWSSFALQTPAWILATVSLVPMLTTWCLMPRFMDQRDRPISFIWATAVAGIIFGAPILHAAWQIAQVPGMATETRNQLLSEGQRLRKSVAVPYVLSLSPRDTDIFTSARLDSRVPVDQVIRWLDNEPQTPVAFIPTLAELRNRRNVPATADQFNVETIFNRLMLERMNFQSSGNWETFSPWLVAASEISRSLRLSVSWRDQDVADVVEIWIADTLQLPTVAEQSSSEAYQLTLKNLPNKTARAKSRRGAVLGSWAAQEFSRRVTKANVIDSGLDLQPPYLVDWIRKPRAEAIVATALQALGGESKFGTIKGDWLVEMHRLQMASSTPFEYGPYAPRLRDRPAIELIRSSAGAAARFWGMKWEDDIDQMKTESGKPASETQQ